MLRIDGGWVKDGLTINGRGMDGWWWGEWRMNGWCTEAGSRVIEENVENGWRVDRMVRILTEYGRRRGRCRAKMTAWKYGRQQTVQPPSFRYDEGSEVWRQCMQQVLPTIVWATTVTWVSLNDWRYLNEGSTNTWTQLAPTVCGGAGPFGNVMYKPVLWLQISKSAM